MKHEEPTPPRHRATPTRRPTVRRLLSAAAALTLVGGASAAAEAAPTDHPRQTQSSRPAGELLNKRTCEALATDFHFPGARITSAVSEAPGTLTFREDDVARHCLVTGVMNERVSPVDGQTYAIGFEMRLPMRWGGQFVYQANGGLDGKVATALGTAGGSDSALQAGMAVLSSDAGHTGQQNPTFGLDPQARLDYGYQAVGALTPMGKALVEEAYGTTPAHSYIAGSSNGGRHAMVAASRHPDWFDGVLAVAPGFQLPKAAVAQLWGAQQWSTMADDAADLASAFTPEERQATSAAILGACDGLDGLEDGLVNDSRACQDSFDLDTAVPTCMSGRTGDCLTEKQKAVIQRVFDGATTSDGQRIYSPFPFDPGLSQADWAGWKFDAPISRDSAAVGYIFSSAPYAPPLPTLRDFVLGLDVDDAYARIHATDGVYTESAWDFMTPPDPLFRDFLASGGKMIVIHGASDGVFSMEATAQWYQEMTAAYGPAVTDNVRFFEVPGMGHTRGGPATDQHDSVAALVDWVEHGTEPDRIEAWVNPDNPELPAAWSHDRSRPLCPFPSVATYTGGDAEDASSFTCATATSGKES